MNNASLELGGDNWAAKDGNLLGYAVGDSSGKYVPNEFTFTRGSNLSATRVNADGLIEKGRENLILQSNAFSTSPWLQTDGTATSGQSGYDGTNNAWLINKSGANGRIRQLVAATGVVTTSVYAKAGTNNWLRISFAKFAFFDLANGVIGNTNAIDTTITSVGNGWYRCTMTANSTSTQFANYYPAEDDNVISGTSGNILMQSIQMEIGLAATGYIPTTAATGKAGILENTPRLDYSGGATCPSLLLEPSRTNLASSEYFEQFWSTSSGGTRVYNQITSPEGVQNGTKIYPTQTGSFKGLSKAFGSSLSSTPYALSIFAKAGEFEHLYFYNVGSPDGNNGVWFNLTTGSVGTNQAAWTSAKMEDFGNGWYRCSAVITPGGSSDNLYIFLADSNGSVTATTNGTDGLYIYGAQLEQGAYPTSYIPNHSGGTITRGADDSVVTGLGSIAGQSEGTLFAYFKTIGDSATPYISLNQNNGVANRVLIYNNSGVSAEIRAGGSVQASITSSTQGLIKAAFAYKANDFAFYINGSQIGTDSSGITFGAGVLNELILGFGAQDGAEMKQVLLFDTRLSNTDLATLTT